MPSSTPIPVMLVQPCPLARKKETHWIEIELLDESGMPVAGELYRVRLRDNSIHEGFLDEHGRARWDGIDAGLCDVWWPRLGNLPALDTPGGQPASAALGPSDAPAKEEMAEQPLAWVEIELVGEDGKPIPTERYRLVLPDGSTEEGVLDDHGRAFFDDIPQGSCELSFPDLASSAWEKL